PLPLHSFPTRRSSDLTGYRYIREGISDLILAGGAEALSHAPLVWPNSGVRWFAGFAGAKGLGAKIAAALKVKPSYFKPIIGLERDRKSTRLNSSHVKI